MNPLERDLRKALQRQQPPGNFAEGVLARVRQSEIKAIRWRWLSVAALLVFVAGGALFVQEQRREAEGKKAKEALIVALRITGSKLRSVQERLDATRQRAMTRLAN